MLSSFCSRLREMRVSTYTAEYLPSVFHCLSPAYQLLPATLIQLHSPYSLFLPCYPNSWPIIAWKYTCTPSQFTTVESLATSLLPCARCHLHSIHHQWQCSYYQKPTHKLYINICILKYSRNQLLQVRFPFLGSRFWDAHLHAGNFLEIIFRINTSKDMKE